MNNTCERCGRKNRILFPEEGEKLCWLCSSKKKLKEMQKNKQDDIPENNFREKRAWKRYPVKMHLKMYYGESEQSKVIYSGTTINLSMGGLCVEWTPCDECSGYEPGRISPDCIFSRYDIALDDSEVLNVSLFLSEDDVLELPAKAVFVIRESPEKEYIGMSLHNPDDNVKKQIEEIIKKVTHG